MRNRSIWRLIAVLLFTVVSFMATPAAVIAADNYPAKEEISDAYSRYILSSAGVNSTVFDETPSIASPYSAGSVSQQTLTYALDTLNFIRYVAHLPEVGLDKNYTNYSQHAAVLLDSIKELAHTPSKPSDMSDDFYNLSYTGASNGNLASGFSTLSAALLGLMADNSGASNLLTLGHRRWLLNPTMGYTGFGVSGKYYAVYAFDRSAAAPNYDFIAWPAAGNQPLEYFTVSTPWSVTLNTSKYAVPSASEIEVTITRQSDDKTWTLSQNNYSDYPSTYTGYFVVNNQNYGVGNCIIFHPGTSNLGQTGLSGAFTVNIRGLKTRGGQSTSLTYTTDFFNLINTMTFNTDGGSSVSGQYVYYGESVAEPAAPTRTGYTFDSWYTDSGLTQAYSFDSAVTGNITLYAKWKANTYIVSYDANGGDGGVGTVPDQTSTYNRVFTFAKNGFTRSNYTLRGWSTSAGGSVVYGLGEEIDKWNLTSDLKLYAAWKPNTYTVTYNAGGGGGEGTVPDQIATYDSGFTFAENGFTRAHYTLLGWSTSEGGSVVYELGEEMDKWNLTSDLRLYAVWKPNTYTLTFETNGGTEISSVTAEAGTVIDLSEYTTTQTYHIFQGWYTDAELTNSVTFITVSGNTTLYANWFKINIHWEYFNAYISGYSDDTVRPKANITREEAAQIFYNLMSSSARVYFETSSNSFSDVASGSWSNKAISTLANAKVLSGYSDGTFRPDKEITRAEFVKIASSFEGLKEINTSEYPFSDISGHWALKYILHAESAGWISGYPDGTFRPDQNITRAEAIKITNAMSGRNTADIDKIENMKTWLDNTDESAWYYKDIQIATNSYDMAPR